MRDYQIISPSLEGVLNHDSLLYEDVKRPLELLRILDGPAAKGNGKDDRLSIEKCSKEDLRILEEYFHDLFGVFLKKLSFFVIQSESEPDEAVKLQAMLQEVIKIKKMITGAMK